MHTVKIGLTEAGRGYVTLDGKDVETVAVAVTSEVDQPTEVTLVIHATVEIEAQVDPRQLRLVKRVPVLDPVSGD
jgi:hypothetical protein